MARSHLRGEQAAERIGGDLRARRVRAQPAAVTALARPHRSGELSSRITSDVGRLLDAVVAATAQLIPNCSPSWACSSSCCSLHPWPGRARTGRSSRCWRWSPYRQRRRFAPQPDGGPYGGRTADRGHHRPDPQRRRRPVVRPPGPGRRRLRTRATTPCSTPRSAPSSTEARWAPRSDLVLAVGSGLVLFVGGLQVPHRHADHGPSAGRHHLPAELYAPVRSLTRLSVRPGQGRCQRPADRRGPRLDELVADRPGAQPVPPEIHSSQFSRRQLPVRRRPCPCWTASTWTCAPARPCACSGRAGSARAPLLSLLLRLYDVDGGAVLIDGVDIRDLQLQSLRARIAYVPQDPWLLDATLAQNIAFGNRGATRAAVIAAGRLAHVDEFADPAAAGLRHAAGRGGRPAVWWPTAPGGAGPGRRVSGSAAAARRADCLTGQRIGGGGHRRDTRRCSAAHRARRHPRPAARRDRHPRRPGRRAHTPRRTDGRGPDHIDRWREVNP